MEKWRGKWALVTGASSGIGWALAEQLAAHGTNLVLTARRADRLAKLANLLKARYRVEAEIFAADLARPQTPLQVQQSDDFDGQGDSPWPPYQRACY